MVMLITMIQDLCDAATLFAVDILKTSGNMVMTFHIGSEDKNLETRLKRMFKTVLREKSALSTMQMLFICLKKRAGVDRGAMLESI